MFIMLWISIKSSNKSLGKPIFRPILPLYIWNSVESGVKHNKPKT